MKQLSREELIQYYEKNLEKVKHFHNPEKARTSFDKERCMDYIKYAENELLAVKNGRKW